MSSRQAKKGGKKGGKEKGGKGKVGKGKGSGRNAKPRRKKRDTQVAPELPKLTDEQRQAKEDAEWWDLFKVGTPIEYEYKGKVWKNGTIITCNEQLIEIQIRNRIDKFKTIQLTKKKALTLYHFRSLKISNVKYPSWIALDEACDVTKSVHTDPYTSMEYKICWYRDAKYITLYSTMQYLKHKADTKNKGDMDIKCLQINDGDIRQIDSNQIITNKFILKRKEHSIDMIYHAIDNYCNIPIKIFEILLEYIQPYTTANTCASNWQKNGYLVQKHRLDPVARVLLMGVYDDTNSLSIFRGMRYIIEKIWKMVVCFNDVYWKPFIETNEERNGMYYTTASVLYNRNRFPPPTNININMMPFIMSRSFAESKLPNFLSRYWKIIHMCDPMTGTWTEHGKICFLTIQESVVDEDRTQRRPGLHVETPGPVSVKGGGNNKEHVHSYFWGKGRIGTDEDGFRHSKTLRKEGGIYMASSVENSCAVWDCKIVKYKGKEALGHLGNIEHLRRHLPGDRRWVMDENCIYWLTDRTPHESLPMEKTGCRQFFRLVTHNVSVWYEQHNTKNPNGVVPDKRFTRIIKKSKFKM
eukprot:163872_1